MALCLLQESPLQESPLQESRGCPAPGFPAPAFLRSPCRQAYCRQRPGWKRRLFPDVRLLPVLVDVVAAVRPESWHRGPSSCRLFLGEPLSHAGGEHLSSLLPRGSSSARALGHRRKEAMSPNHEHALACQAHPPNPPLTSLPLGTLSQLLIALWVAVRPAPPSE